MSKKNRIKVGGRVIHVSRKKHTNYVSKERQEALQAARKNDLYLAGKLFFKFKAALLATPTRGEDLAGRFLALRDRIRKEVSNRRIRALCLEMVDSAVEKARAVFGTPEVPPEDAK